MTKRTVSNAVEAMAYAMFGEFYFTTISLNEQKKKDTDLLCQTRLDMLRQAGYILIKEEEK